MILKEFREDFKEEVNTEPQNLRQNRNYGAIMSKKKIRKRIVALDPKYNSTEIVRFTNKLMYGGNKSVVQGILYQVIEELEKNNKPGKEIFDQALKNVMPTVEVKPRRVGGATYQVPVEVKPARRLSLGIRWIVDAARSRSGMSLKRKAIPRVVRCFQWRKVLQLKRKKIHTGWLKLIELLLITGGKNMADLQKLRNIGFIAHIDAGKQLLLKEFYFTGTTYKIGSIDDGTAVMDFMEIEKKEV